MPNRLSATNAQVNFFFEYCALLRKRDNAINEQLAGFSYYFFSVPAQWTFLQKWG